MTRIVIQRDRRVPAGTHRLIPERCCMPGRKGVSFVAWVGVQSGYHVALLRCRVCRAAWEAHYLIPADVLAAALAPAPDYPEPDYWGDISTDGGAPAT